MATARRTIDRIPIFVALIGLIGTGWTVFYTGQQDSGRQPCVWAGEWLRDETPNTSLSDEQRTRISAAMMIKALECIR
jgi:hypothetical protein